VLFSGNGYTDVTISRCQPAGEKAAEMAKQTKFFYIFLPKKGEHAVLAIMTKDWTQIYFKDWRNKWVRLHH
jgi:hypothetical protein